jgi:hypothetical protein
MSFSDTPIVKELRYKSKFTIDELKIIFEIKFRKYLIKSGVNSDCIIKYNGSYLNRNIYILASILNKHDKSYTEYVLNKILSTNTIIKYRNLEKIWHDIYESKFY